MEDNANNIEESRELLSKSVVVKIVSIASVETASVVQLNNIATLIIGNLSDDKVKSRAEIVKLILDSSVYKQHLLHIPTSQTLYCFDGQSQYVCLFHELDNDKHCIIVNPKKLKSYQYDNIELSFQDKIKILLQDELCAQHKLPVLELPWPALTLSQMISVFNDKCQELDRKKLDKLLSTVNPGNLMAAAIKKSAALKDFTSPALFDKTLTFGFDIEEPLNLLDWASTDVPEIIRYISDTKSLLTSVAASRKRKQPADMINRESSRKGVTSEPDPYCEENKQPHVLNLRPEPSNRETTPDNDYQRYHQQETNSTEINTSSPSSINQVAPIEEQKHDQLIIENISLITEPSLEQTNLSRSITELDNTTNLIVSEEAASTDQDIVKTPTINTSTPLKNWSQAPSMPVPSNQTTVPDEAREITGLSSCLTLKVSDNFNITVNSSVSAEHRVVDNYCNICTTNCKNKTLDCSLCGASVHFCCYIQARSNKTLPVTYFDMAQKSLVNHKWFCNECNEAMSSGNLLKWITQGVMTKIQQIYSTPTECRHSESETTKQSTIIELQHSSEALELTSDVLEHWQHHLPANNALEKINSQLVEMEKRQAVQLQSLNTNSNRLAERLDLLQNLEVENNTTSEQTAAKHLQINKRINGWLQHIDTTLVNHGKVLTDLQNSSHKSTVANCHMTSSSSYRDTTVKDSTLREGPTFYQHKRVNSTVDPAKTVIILKDVDKDKVKDSKNIKSTFNKYFPNMEIQTCFISKGGSVFIELKTPDDAKKVEYAWKPHFFTNESRSNTTVCRILKKMNNSVVVKHVPIDISNSELTNIVEELYTGATATRFITKDNIKLQTIKIDFNDSAHQEDCIANGLKIENQIFRAEKYLPRQRIIQCFKCFKYGHVAKFCRKHTETCKYCSGDHCAEECPHPHGYYDCRNCGSREHGPSSKDCRAYKDIVQELKLKERNPEFSRW